MLGRFHFKRQRRCKHEFPLPPRGSRRTCYRAGFSLPDPVAAVVHHTTTRHDTHTSLRSFIAPPSRHVATRGRRACTKHIHTRTCLSPFPWSTFSASRGSSSDLCRCSPHVCVYRYLRHASPQQSSPLASPRHVCKCVYIVYLYTRILSTVRAKIDPSEYNGDLVCMEFWWWWWWWWWMHVWYTYTSISLSVGAQRSIHLCNFANPS